MHLLTITMNPFVQPTLLHPNSPSEQKIKKSYQIKKKKVLLRVRFLVSTLVLVEKQSLERTQ